MWLENTLANRTVADKTYVKGADATRIPWPPGGVSVSAETKSAENEQLFIQLGKSLRFLCKHRFAVYGTDLWYCGRPAVFSGGLTF